MRTIPKRKMKTKTLNKIKMAPKQLAQMVNAGFISNQEVPALEMAHNLRNRNLKTSTSRAFKVMLTM
jgi:hypothetical protein